MVSYDNTVLYRLRIILLHSKARFIAICRVPGPGSNVAVPAFFMRADTFCVSYPDSLRGGYY